MFLLDFKSNWNSLSRKAMVLTEAGKGTFKKIIPMTNKSKVLFVKTRRDRLIHIYFSDSGTTPISMNILTSMGIIWGACLFSRVELNVFV